MLVFYTKLLLWTLRQQLKHSLCRFLSTTFLHTFRKQQQAKVGKNE